MSGHTTAPDLLWSIVLAESKGHVPILLFLRAAHSSVRQAGGSSSYSHGFPSSIDGVSGRSLPCPRRRVGSMLTAPPFS